MSVVLMVKSGQKGSRWRKHGEYATRDEAWLAITSLADKRAHVRLVEGGATPEANHRPDVNGPTAPVRSPDAVEPRWAEP